MAETMQAGRERPILFSGPMIRALLDGRKTQTRRVVKPQPALRYVLHDAPAPVERHEVVGPWCHFYGPLEREEGRSAATGGMFTVRCPYGAPGDRLWVRETWGYHGGDEYLYQHDRGQVEYRADGFFGALDAVPGGRWRPSIHMPRWASRITLEIAGVRVERVQDISEEDAIAEGVGTAGADNSTHRAEFMRLWDSLNDARGFGWRANPWVWVIEFRESPHAG